MTRKPPPPPPPEQTSLFGFPPPARPPEPDVKLTLHLAPVVTSIEVGGQTMHLGGAQLIVDEARRLVGPGGDTEAAVLLGRAANAATVLGEAATALREIEDEVAGVLPSPAALLGVPARAADPVRRVRPPSGPPPAKVTNPLKWAGGKGWLLSTIERHVGDLRRHVSYSEPFMGSGAVFFGLRRLGMTCTAFLSDSNWRLVSFYRHVKGDVAEVARIYEAERERYHEAADNASREAVYLSWREILRRGDGAVRDAAIFLLINRGGYNGLYRENKSGLFNVPHGKAKRLPDLADALADCHALLANTVLVSRPWEESLAGVAGDGDLVYIDAPYAGTFTGYSSQSWREADDRALADAICEAVERGARVLWSLPDTEHARQVVTEAGRLVKLVEAAKPGQISAGPRQEQRELLAIFDRRG